MKFDVITFGSATRDIIIRPKKLTNLQYNAPEKEDGSKSAKAHEVCFPLGSKIDIGEIYFNSGGGGTNTAATFAKQGMKAAFCGMIGNDLSGKEMVNELKAMKVDVKLIAKTDERPTNHSIVILDGETNMSGKADRTILAYRGAAELLPKEKIPFKKLQTKWLYLAPLTGKLGESFEALVEFAKKHKIKVAVNPSMAQLALPNFAGIAQYIDLLIMNAEEASFVTKTNHNQEQDIFAKLDAMCPGVTIMTKGAEGVIVSDNVTMYSAKPNESRQVVDTTGAGDAFGAGFASAFMRGQSIEESIQLGMANAEGCVSQIGAKGGLLKKGDTFESVKVTKQLLV